MMSIFTHCPFRGGSVSVFELGIGIRYFFRYFLKSVRYSVSVLQNTGCIAIDYRYRYSDPPVIDIAIFDPYTTV
jgi:hypothetical protein